MMFSQYIVLTRRSILRFTTLTLAIFFIVIIYMPTPAQTHPLSPIDDEDIPIKIYCSTALFEAIKAICDGRYYSLPNKYPDSFGKQRASLLRRLLPAEDDIYQPSRSGAVHNCCRRPCGYSELQTYCAD